MADTFTWTSEETFQAVNVLTADERRYNDARWNIAMWLWPEDSLREILADVPLSEPIDLDKVDWRQVAETIGGDDSTWEGPPPTHPSRW